MPKTQVSGGQVRDESITGDDVLDGSLGRSEMDITTPGNSVITQFAVGSGLEVVSETGADPGTGLVTVRSNDIARFEFHLEGGLPDGIDERFFNLGNMNHMERGFLPLYGLGMYVVQNVYLWFDIPPGVGNETGCTFWTAPSIGTPVPIAGLTQICQASASFIGLAVNLDIGLLVNEIGLSVSRVNGSGASLFSKATVEIYAEKA